MLGHNPRIGAQAAGEDPRLPVMARFAVQITETTRSIEAPVSPHEPTPMVRDVYWEGEAADEEAAKEAAYRAWDVKYGEGKQPVSAIVKVTKLDYYPSRTALVRGSHARQRGELRSVLRGRVLRLADHRGGKP